MSGSLCLGSFFFFFFFCFFFFLLGDPSGTVAEIAEEGELSIKSNKGNTVTRKADPADPAVRIAREGNDVVKRAHELQVEEKGK